MTSTRDAGGAREKPIASMTNAEVIREVEHMSVFRKRFIERMDSGNRLLSEHGRRTKELLDRYQQIKHEIALMLDDE